jgi:transposase
MEQVILGIDVSKDKLDVALLQGEQCLHKVITNNPKGFEQLGHWLKNRKTGEVHACLEATGQYGDAVARYLYQEGHQVSVVNPARIKAYATSQLSRNKTANQMPSSLPDFAKKRDLLCGHHHQKAL